MAQQSQAFVFITRVAQTLLAFSPRNDEWIRVTATLRSAGPVVGGYSANMLPVSSGAGRSLTTNQPVEFVLAPGQRFYLASNGIDLVDLQIDALPWAENIVQLIGKVAGVAPGQPAGGTGQGPVEIGKWGFDASHLPGMKPPTTKAKK